MEVITWRLLLFLDIFSVFAWSWGNSLETGRQKRQDMHQRSLAAIEMATLWWCNMHRKLWATKAHLDRITWTPARYTGLQFSTLYGLHYKDFTPENRVLFHGCAASAPSTWASAPFWTKHLPAQGGAHHSALFSLCCSLGLTLTYKYGKGGCSSACCPSPFFILASTATAAERTHDGVALPPFFFFF